jgi:transposase
MKQTYKAGEKMFIDYAGTTMAITNSKTGEIRNVQIFLGVLGQSNYTYIEATESQNSKDFISSHINAFKFFGGCPEILVPDNLKSGVTATCKYEPSINKSYRAMADHYGAVVVPARVRKPKDKAKVEGGVLIASRWILAALRNRVFFSLEELNNSIWELLDKYNEEEFQKREGSRKTNFENFEKNALMKLPSTHYEVAEWKNVKSNIDYHIEVDHCYYSVHYKFRNKQLTARCTDSSIEIFLSHQRIAVHRRVNKRGSRSTTPEHMPKSHREYGEWSPSRIISWAEMLRMQLNYC